MCVIAVLSVKNGSFMNVFKLKVLDPMSRFDRYDMIMILHNVNDRYVYICI